MLTQEEKREIQKHEEAEKYQIWFEKHWEEAGGLITKNAASRILGRSTCLITRMIDRGIIREHKYNPKSDGFVELKQVAELREKYNFKYAEFAIKIIRQATGIQKSSLEKFLEGINRETIERAKAACNTTSITKRAKPQTRPSRKNTSKSAGRPRTPKGKRGRVRKAVQRASKQS